MQAHRRSLAIGLVGRSAFELRHGLGALIEHVLRTVPRVFEGLDDMLPAGSFSAKNRARAVGWCERRAIYDVEDLRRYFSAAATTHMNTPPEMLGP